MGAKEKQFTFRFSNELVDKIEDVIRLMNDKTGLIVNRTQVVESAVVEGLKVISAKLSK